MNTLTKVLPRVRSQVPTAGGLTESVTNLVGLTRYRPIPLHDKLSDALEPIGASYEGAPVTISNLNNGIRVVSRNTNEVVSNVGIYVDVGSRYLAPHSCGAVDFMKDMQMNFLPTRTRTRLDASCGFYRLGSGMQISAFRDCLMYRGECFKSSMQGTLDVMADLALNTDFEDWLVRDNHDEYMWRRGDQWQNAEEIIPELLHQAAYQGNTYGLPLHPNESNVHEINGDLMRHVHNIFFQPSRILCVGVGVEHEALEDIAFNSLGHIREGDNTDLTVQKAPPKYTGGERRLEREMGDWQTHVGLAFETENWHSKDLMAMCVLNMMMGGGGSFSAGGPGKGMYTRLYQDALARWSYITHISCSHSIYEDTALFCYYGTSAPEHAGRLVDVMCHQAKQAADKAATPQELERAKTALANNICYEYERREVQFEDIARQCAVYGKHRSPEEWFPEIMSVTAEDVSRVAQKMLKKPPTVVAAGHELSYLPVYTDVMNKFN